MSDDITENQWHDLAQRYAAKDWSGFDYPDLIKAVCRDYAAVLAQHAAPAPQAAGAVTDAMVDAYLAAQRHTVEEADRFGRPNVGGLHTNTVREATRNGLRAAIALAAAPAAPAGDAVTQAARDVLAERRRQIEAEGYDRHHDDSEHDDTTALARAAGCYLLHGDAHPDAGRCPAEWPWDASYWKPKDRRRNAVRAAALALAEIERLDRAAQAAGKGAAS